MKIKFPVIGRAGEAKDYALQARKCYVEAIKRGKKRRTEESPKIEDSNKRGKNPIPSPEPDKETPTVQPVEELLTIELTPGDPGKVTKIGSKMTEDVRIPSEEKRHFCMDSPRLGGIDKVSSRTTST
ncbi:UNVERIFIED_CONTAM: hypothetical protein Sradi_1332100 [Sesamum radiatum]|uniref:Uncharacterized protein n=1 Tax=Sesamum radiatum TaxID=300843 RepID=A0AAW2UV30_SESRA